MSDNEESATTTSDQDESSTMSDRDEPKKDSMPVEFNVEDDADLIDVSEQKNRGCLKKILKEGSGEATPFEGSTVNVHYVGRLLDGTVFDSSRKRDEPFSFELGKRKVIKGWDEGVATMKKGELCELVCTPEYAYGKSGSSPNIPANATLVFQVELLNWEEEDISKEKNGSVRRQVLHKGSGYTSPNDDAKCNLKIVGKIHDKVFDERELEYVVGEPEEADLIPGFDVAVKKMKKGEKSLFTFSPDLAFGKEGDAKRGVEANEEVQYEITLVDFEKGLESWSMSVDQKLAAAENARAKGTSHFSSGNLKGAVKQYERIKSFLGSDPEFKDDHETKRKHLLAAGHSNLAMTHLKMNNYLAARNAAGEVISVDSGHIKGYYRRGMAHMQLKDFEDARKDFQKVLELEPDNKEAKRQLAAIAKETKAQSEKERKTYQGMFERWSKEDAKKEPKVESKKAENGDGKKTVGDLSGAENEFDSGDSVEKIVADMESSSA